MLTAHLSWSFLIGPSLQASLRTGLPNDIRKAISSQISVSSSVREANYNSDCKNPFHFQYTFRTSLTFLLPETLGYLVRCEKETIRNWSTGEKVGSLDEQAQWGTLNKNRYESENWIVKPWHYFQMNENTFKTMLWWSLAQWAKQGSSVLCGNHQPVLQPS